MVERIVEFLRPYFGQWGYLIVGVAIFLENSVAAGVVFPGETLLLVGAFYAAQGELSIVWITVVASVAAILGDNVGYLIGRRFGRGFLERHGRWLASPERLERVEAFFRRHGGKTIFFARFIPVLRSVVCLAAGVSRMRYARFVRWDVPGAVLWCTANTMLGYLVGQSYPVLKRFLSGAGLAAAALLAVAVWLPWWVRRRRKPREEVEAETR